MAKKLGAFMSFMANQPDFSLNFGRMSSGNDTGV
jgi:hypothetical protein